MIKSVPEQLTDIYFNEEHWHKTRLSRTAAFRYHKKRIDSGDIQVYIENEEVLGYYERYLLWNACYLYNVWIKEGCRKGKVFKELEHRFFSTMPKHINVVIGTKQGSEKLQKAVVKDWRKHGKH